MQLSVPTLALINTALTLALALMLWLGIQGDRSVAHRALHLRALALLLEAGGFAVLAMSSVLPPAMLPVFGNTLNVAATSITVVALRLLLRRKLRWQWVLGLALTAWLGLTWLGTIRPDYQQRVLWGSVFLLTIDTLNILALWPGRRRGENRAQYLLLWIYLGEIALLIWRNITLSHMGTPLTGIDVSVSVNNIYVLLLGLQPLVTGVGFLLLYNEILQRDLYQLARTDPLTGVTNRLGLLEASTLLLAHARRQGQSVGVLLIDADHFKSINDRFGHDDGDRVLLELVGCIRGILRGPDMVGRVGGEEFLVLAPGVNSAQLQALAERIRHAVASSTFAISGEGYALTVSIGAALADDAEPDLMAARRRADVALYEAKRAGRNCVMVAPR